MTIAVECAHCGKLLKVKDELAGKKGKCPQCQKVLTNSRGRRRRRRGWSGGRKNRCKNRLHSGSGSFIRTPCRPIVRAGTANHDRRKARGKAHR